MTATSNKSQTKGSIAGRKWQAFPGHHANYIPSLNDLVLKTKLSFARKIKLFSVMWTYIPYSSDSFIRSLWWQPRATQKRTVLPLATVGVKTLPAAAPFGATPAAAVKRTEKTFFSVKEGSKRSSAYEWAEDISPKKSMKDSKGSFGPKKHFGIKDNLQQPTLEFLFYFQIFPFCFIWDYL